MSIRESLRDPKLRGLVQFIKFGLVGVSNTAISYGVEMLCYYVLFGQTDFTGIAGLLCSLGLGATDETVRIVLTSVLAFVISVTNSYYWNSRYVFKAGERRSVGQHVRAYLRTMLCYGITGLVLSPVLKVWLNGLGVPYWAASLGSLVVTIPLNFVLNKFWAFAGKKNKSGKSSD
jgi:putative flippase GtrA